MSPKLSVMNGMENVAGLEMQMNNMFELHKQMTTGAMPTAMNQFSMHSELLPQQQAILSQQHILSQQFAAQSPVPHSPMSSQPARGRGINANQLKIDNRKRKRKDPNRPKRAMTPYFFFAAEYRNSLRREGKPVPGVKEVAQYCGPKWNSMPEEERRPFVESAERDRQRYLEEMNIYKKPRDEDKPKRPASAYFHFLVDFRKKMAGKPLPEHTTIPKLSGALWQKMTEDERRPYNEKMEQEKKVYEQKLADYRKMKAEEAIKLAEKTKPEDGGVGGGYSEYTAPPASTPVTIPAASAAASSSSTTSTPQLTMPQIPAEYTDINRQLQMV
eukprot:sb/3466684/